MEKRYKFLSSKYIQSIRTTTKETRSFFIGQSVLKMYYVKVFKNVGIENKK